jgi:hypothetical protein
MSRRRSSIRAHYLKYGRAQGRQPRPPTQSVTAPFEAFVGNFKNGGTDYRPKGDPQRANVHFENKKLGKVCPVACTM